MTDVSRRDRLLVVLGLTVSLVSGLVIVGIGGHSIALLAPGGDYLADSGAILWAFLAIWLLDRPSIESRLHGYVRATAHAGPVKAGLLLAVVMHQKLRIL